MFSIIPFNLEKILAMLELQAVSTLRCKKSSGDGWLMQLQDKDPSAHFTTDSEASVSWGNGCSLAQHPLLFFKAPSYTPSMVARQWRGGG